ncbi:MAG: transglutaminase domain-containing protein [Pirellulales bacterium]
MPHAAQPKPEAATQSAQAATVDAALARAGDNRSQIQTALDAAPSEQHGGMKFLVENMPDRDLKKLSAEFLLENVRLAYATRDAAPWKDRLPDDVFYNDVLPYANINERRDDWRKDFRERFGPLVKDAKTPGDAAAILNQKIFPLLKVRYSTQRRRADQAPYESIESGLASCTGLSVLLIDACRSVGVPARFAGTPLWSDNSGNHSWVEVWDDGWHFTGAAEPSGNDLDRAWFIGRASKADRDHSLHAIYAVSYRRTPQKFPLVWDRDIDYVHAVNVTDRYLNLGVKIPEGSAQVMFRVLNRPGGERQAVHLKIVDAAGAAAFEGTTNDERFDANDHLTVVLKVGAKYNVEVGGVGTSRVETIEVKQGDGPITWYLTERAAEKKSPDDSAEVNPATPTIAALEAYLNTDAKERPKLAEQDFANKPLSRAEAEAAQSLLWKDHAERIRAERANEMEARELVHGDKKMPFFYKVFGDKPEKGRSLYISMHGGGGAPKQVNDSQWENQKRLYDLKEGVYCAPRAPTDTWNLWHEGHIAPLFDRLIEDLIVFEDVDTERVYLMGYSAGGDGVFQLAPRMADRFAAAAMMAGHPNETSPLGLRNLPFTIHVGANDAAYNRNKIAAEWGKKLDELHAADAEGYMHLTKLHAGKGHWMDREDAEAIPWMAEFRRNTLPEKIVWKQDDVVGTRFYWLAVDPANAGSRAEVRATRDGQSIDVEATGIQQIAVRLCDAMCNLDEPVTLTSGGKTLFSGRVERSIATLAKTLAERGDPTAVFSAEQTVSGIGSEAAQGE